MQNSFENTRKKHLYKLGLIAFCNLFTVRFINFVIFVAANA